MWGWILYRGRTWTQEGQRAVLILHPQHSEVITPLSVAVWNPSKSSIVLLKLPNDLMFQASHNREMYQLSTLPRLAEIEAWHERRWLREVSLQLGVILDGSITVTIPQEDFTTDTLVSESQKSLWRNKTTLGWWDRFTWWRGVRATPQLKREVLVFDSQWLTAEKLINQAHFDRVARLRLQDDVVRQSQWAVRVVNASGVAGDAGRQARLLELVGFNVLTIETQTSQTESSLELDAAAMSSENSAETAWAASRIRMLYGDWQSQLMPELVQQKRVESEVIQGIEQTDSQD